MAYVGVDGCRAGWFYFSLEDGDLTWGIVPRVSDLVNAVPDSSNVLIDIPIGLRSTDDGERLCDLEARRLLAPVRHPSVFPAPARQALGASSYEEASSINREILGKGLSKQTWAIAPKIREVDELLRSSTKARGMLREVHPEVCFCGLAGRPMQHSKKKREGYEERMAVLRRYYPEADSVIREASKPHARNELVLDDVVDAFVVSLCARQIGACKTLPQQPEIDATGLPMEIVYLPLS